MNGCQGINMRDGSNGIYTAGAQEGCACKSACSNEDGDCNKYGCEGKDKFCTKGDYAGCSCGTVCGWLKPRSCNRYNCNGKAGFCTSGKYKGRPCELKTPTKR
ncbi:hypothetical protein B0O99DRAFT_629372 [Bisporella sp. PMI_857]|nr:hypothetical protein B0O99DRAFT_629372 [Bisporella sp. PMI_857]